MKNPEQEIFFMSEKSKNSDEISASRAQAIPMGNNLPPVMLAAFPGASHHIPAENPGSEIEEALYGNQNTVVGKSQKRKRYHRYNELQVKSLEAFFIKCPRPDHFQRKDLGDSLGIDPMKVKFWFQNKHTKLRHQREHKKKVEYQSENQKLLIENFKLKQALASCTCQKCGSTLVNREIMTSPEDLLKLENDKLEEEIKHITWEILKFGGNPWASSTSIPSPLSED